MAEGFISEWHVFLPAAASILKRGKLNGQFVSH
jgi:hypothetical protein